MDQSGDEFVRELEQAFQRGEVDDTLLERLHQEALKASIEFFVTFGDTINAERVQTLAPIQDRVRSGMLTPGDLDQLLAWFQETSRETTDTNDIMEAKILGTLVTAQQLGHLPATYRDRVIEAGRMALRSERGLTRSSGLALMFILDARSEIDEILPLLEDPKEEVREQARRIVARWSRPSE